MESCDAERALPAALLANPRETVPESRFAELAGASVMAAEIAGRPDYLAMAMTPEGGLRRKPQNLLVDLPLAERA